MIPTPNQYSQVNAATLQGIVKRIPKVRQATVYGITANGNAILIFTADGVPDEKQDYKSYDSYTPKIGHRVQLLNGVIQGGWYPDD